MILLGVRTGDGTLRNGPEWYASFVKHVRS